MLYSLDAGRDRLLTNSPCTQTSGAELPSKVDSLHEGSSVRLTQPSIGEVPTAALESCRLVPRWSYLQVASRDIRTSGHASRRVHKTTFPQSTADRCTKKVEGSEMIVENKAKLAAASGGSAPSR